MDVGTPVDLLLSFDYQIQVLRDGAPRGAFIREHRHVR